MPSLQISKFVPSSLATSGTRKPSSSAQVSYSGGTDSLPQLRPVHQGFCRTDEYWKKRRGVCLDQTQSATGTSPSEKTTSSDRPTPIYGTPGGAVQVFSDPFAGLNHSEHSSASWQKECESSQNGDSPVVPISEVPEESTPQTTDRTRKLVKKVSTYLRGKR